MKTTLVVIAILILVIIGIYYLIPNNTANAPSYIQTSQNTPTSSNSNVSTPVSTSTSNSQSNETITIKNFAYAPKTLAIKTGTKVVWINNDTASHTITSDSGNILNSGIVAPGNSFSFTFTNPGTINYHCSIHPMMRGTITVTN